MQFIFAHHADRRHNGDDTPSDIFKFYFCHFSGLEPPPPLSCVVWRVSLFRKQPITLVTSDQPARLPACISATPVDGFPLNLISGDFYETLLRNSIF